LSKIPDPTALRAIVRTPILLPLLSPLQPLFHFTDASSQPKDPRGPH